MIRCERTHLSRVVDRPRVGVVVNPGAVAAVNVFAPLVVIVEVVVIHLGRFCIVLFVSGKFVIGATKNHAVRAACSGGWQTRPAISLAVVVAMICS